MAFVIWERRARELVHSSGTPIVFNASQDATNFIQRLNQHGADARSPKPIYDVVTVTVT